MKRLTAVIAAVAALGMATPSWAEYVDAPKILEILANGEVLASFPPRLPLLETTIKSEVDLLIRYNGEVYHCSFWLDLKTKASYKVCYDGYQ